MSNAVSKIEPHDQAMTPAVGSTTPGQMLAYAMSQNVDLDRLERLYALQVAWEERNAEKQFNAAVAAFKADPPQVYKDKENKQYGSSYTSIGNLVNTVNAALSPHGLSTRWDVKQSDKITVTCILSHVGGHSVRVEMSGPPDGSGNKNELQKIKSTVTYLKLATYELATGVASQEGNQDDDGNAAGLVPITFEQEAALRDLLVEAGADIPKFCDYMQVDALDSIPANEYAKAESAAKAKLRLAKKAAS